MSQSIYYRKVDPVKQALLVFSLAVVLMGLAWLLTRFNLIVFEPLFPWSIATAFLLLFGVLNSILSLSAEKSGVYWGRSMYSFLGLAFLTGLVARYISGVPVGEAESYKFIYLVITIGYLVFISMVNFIKKIVNYAEKEEWNGPKRRSR